MCKAINLCFSCMREYSSGHDKSCLVAKLGSKKKDAAATGKTKYNFTCKDRSCSRHMWICSKHKHVNQASMDAKAAQLESDHNLKLIHFLGCNNSNISRALRGRNKPVNGFYDSGCSNACLRTGVPGSQLKGQVLAKGPFNITGVNGVNITAQDEWLVHLDREDGRKQLLRGVTLDTITGESPIFNIEKATTEVKADKPDDPNLQNCSLPECVGGVVDVLIGIQ